MANKSTKNMNKHGDARGLHPNSLKNLKPNMNGRPRKDISLTSLLKDELEKIPDEKDGRTWRQLLVSAWLTGAMRNPVLLKELLDRLEGRVTQPISGEVGEPLAIRVEIVNSSDNNRTFKQIN